MVINPGVFYLFYLINFIYLTYRFYSAGKKGSNLALDMSRFMLVYAIALFVEAAGLVIFANDPYALAFVTKIINFGLWYIALAVTAPVFCKLVIPRVSTKYVILFFIVFGVSLIVYQLPRLEPVIIDQAGIPLWKVNKLVMILQGFVTVIYYTLIGVTYGYQGIKAGYPTRGILFAVGSICISLFLPLTYAVENRNTFLAMTVFSLIGQTILTFSIWSNKLPLTSLRYFNEEKA